jgi:MoaA/NifB/PqqE/SkfB family radical SAM enzyme
MFHKLRSLFTILFGRLPGQLVIQISNYCNASCPQCGMRTTASIERHKLAAEDIKNTLDQCASNGIEAVSLTGGEPFINRAEILELLTYAGGAGIGYLRSGTNGYMFTNGGKAAGSDEIRRFALDLAATKIRNFWLSMDSADTQTHETMRGLPGVIEGIAKALPIFHDAGIYPAVNLGINRNIAGTPIPPLEGPQDESRFFEAFRGGFTAFFSKALTLGFTMANVCYPMSSLQEGLKDEKAAYTAISDDAVINFSPTELRLVFKALLKVIPRFRDKIRIFTPLSVLYALSNEEAPLLFPCLGGCSYFYLDSKDGRLYPCGYRGNEDLGADLSAAVREGRNTKPFCMKCHWECFRDPSQLFGIARSMIRGGGAAYGNPSGRVRWHSGRRTGQKRLDKRMLKLWFEDIAYYIRCDFFDGRKPGPPRPVESSALEQY